jgi:hypothetical protein
MKYDTDFKAHYRRAIWSAIAEASMWHVDAVNAFVIDTAAALEVGFLVNEIGLSQNQIVVCNQSPAHVATIRRAFADVVTIGLPASGAFDRLAASKQTIAHANLDFCSQLSWPILNTMRRIGLSRVLGVIDDKDRFEPESVVAITLLGGREHASTTRLLDRVSVDSIAATHCHISNSSSVFCGSCSARDKARLSTAALATGLSVTIAKAFKYRSPSGQPMLCGVFNVFGERPERPRYPRFHRSNQNADLYLKMYDDQTVRYEAWTRSNDLIDEFLMSKSETAEQEGLREAVS